MKFITPASLCAFMGALLLTQNAVAGVIIQGTRVIYPSDEKEVSVRIFNKGNKPSLVQTWVDAGDTASTPDKVKGVPFIVTPPVFRMESEKGQVLRMSFTGEKQLPTDRESLYWLNVLDVPPQAKDQSINALQLAFRTRIKIFYRPAGLKSKAGEAAAALEWKAKNSGGRTVLTAKNPTPYYISLNSVYFGNTQKDKEKGTSGMIAPFSQKDFSMPGNSVAMKEVSYSSINDYGSLQEHKKNLLY